MNLFEDDTTEINVTPLIDIFLVLLSIFIALSILYFKSNTYQEKIIVPSSNTVNISKEKFKFKYIFVFKNLNIKFNNKKYKTIKEFKKFLYGKKFNNKNHFNIVANENIKYKYIIEIMDILKKHNVNNINLELRKK